MCSARTVHNQRQDAEEATKTSPDEAIRNVCSDVLQEGHKPRSLLADETPQHRKCRALGRQHHLAMLTALRKGGFIGPSIAIVMLMHKVQSVAFLALVAHCAKIVKLHSSLINDGLPSKHERGRSMCWPFKYNRRSAAHHNTDWTTSYNCVANVQSHTVTVLP